MRIGQLQDRCAQAIDCGMGGDMGDCQGAKPAARLGELDCEVDRRAGNAWLLDGGLACQRQRAAWTGGDA